MDTVYQIVTVHDGSYARLLHGLPERREIDFVEGALVHIGAHAMAGTLLVVGREMLDRGHDPFLLHAQDVLHGGFTSQVRILTKVFVIATAKRRPVNIHARAQQDAHPAGSRILTQSVPQFARKVPVPGGRRQNSAGEQGAHGVVPNALRAVGHPDFRDTQPGNGVGIEGPGSGDEINFLVQGHLVYQGGGPLFMSLGNDHLCPDVLRGQAQDQHHDGCFFHSTVTSDSFIQPSAVFSRLAAI